MKDLGEDSPDDLPSTVQSLTAYDRQVKELRSAFSGQHLDDIPKEESGDGYIWKKADEYLKSWLNQNGYVVLESEIFEDCIGYRCNRNNYAYTIFMYAYGQKKTAQLDGDYCKKLLDLELSSLWGTFYIIWDPHFSTVQRMGFTQLQLSSLWGTF